MNINVFVFLSSYELKPLLSCLGKFETLIMFRSSLTAARKQVPCTRDM